MSQHVFRPLAAASACVLLPALLLAQEPTDSSAEKPAETAGTATEAPPAIALVRPDGVYQDLAEQGGDLTGLLLGGAGAKPKAFYDFLGRVEGLAESQTPQVVLDLSAQFAFEAVHMSELARAVAKVRDSGKEVVAYIENAESGTYQIAAMCDRVLMADLGVLDIGSPAMNVMFMKDALDLLGVHFDVVRCGDFKGAVEPYVLPRMSDHLRSHYVAMLEQINSAAVERIARHRGLSQADVRQLQAKRLFTADQAKEAGLVDALVPWRGAKFAMGLDAKDRELEFDDVLSEKKSRRSINFMQAISQIFNPRQEDDDEGVESIVVLHLSGTIVDGEKDAPGSIVSKPTVARIEKLRQDEAVHGIVVRINSPGGSATASEAILLALRDLAAAKPVVVSMGGLAASGGYYITCFNRPILAEAETITGSIGVFGMKPSVGALMRRVGLHSELVSLDAAAGMSSIDRAWSDDQRDRVQTMVDRIYDVFIGHVAGSRGMTSSEVLAIAGGRVWSGSQAVEKGLVDRIGGLDDAVAMVRKEAGLGDDVEVRHVPQPRNLFESLFSDMLQAEALIPDPTTRALAKRLDLDRALWVLRETLANEQPVTIWAMLPDAMTLR